MSRRWSADARRASRRGRASSASTPAASRRRPTFPSCAFFANGSRAATPARWRICTRPPSGAPTSATSCRRRERSSSPRPSTTPTVPIRPSAPIPAARTSRATPGATTTTTSSARRLDALLAWMREAAPEPFEARAYVDTGPVQERVYAQHAGIGWIGKNTLRDQSASSARGSSSARSSAACRSTPTRRRSISAAPARCASRRVRPQALVAPGVLDSTRCISYLTIEHRGAIPDDVRAGDRLARLRLRHLSGSLPVERRAPRSTDPAWQPRPAWDAARASLAL